MIRTRQLADKAGVGMHTTQAGVGLHTLSAHPSPTQPVTMGSGTLINPTVVKLSPHGRRALRTEPRTIYTATHSTTKTTKTRPHAGQREPERKP